MARSFKIAFCSISAAALLAGFYWLFSRTGSEASYPEQTVKLSNSAALRIQGSFPAGGDIRWELSYRNQSAWEKVNDWGVEGQIGWYGGNILACPVGKMVVVVREDGSIVFVRTETGRWKTFYMEIPEKPPFPRVGANGGTDLTSLGSPTLQMLRSAMSVEPSRPVPPLLGQFVPETRELWVDYLNPSNRRFRFRFMLTADGETLEFLDLQERPFNRATDTSGPPYFILLPDKSVSPACSKIEFLK